MTRRRSIITAVICTIGLLTVALLLAGVVAGNAYAQVGSPAHVLQTTTSYASSLSANPDGPAMANNAGQDGPRANVQPKAGVPFDRTGADTTLDKSVIFLFVSFGAILATAWVSIFTWGRARS